MKKTLLIAIASLFALASCTKEKAGKPAAKTSTKVQTHCPVSGEELGSMGEPVVVTHDGTSVKLCCDKCMPKFEKDPAKYADAVKNSNS